MDEGYLELDSRWVTPYGDHEGLVIPKSAEEEKRWHSVVAANANHRLEGFPPLSPAQIAEANEFIVGVATPEELIARAKKEYGIG